MRLILVEVFEPLLEITIHSLLLITPKGKDNWYGPILVTPSSFTEVIIENELQKYELD